MQQDTPDAGETRIPPPDEHRQGSSAARAGGARSGSATRKSDLLMQDRAKAWIRDHQDAAMLAAFALGVFAGAWKRG